MAIESGIDANAAFQSDRRYAAYFLMSKAALNAVAAVGSGYIGVLYSGPLLQRIGMIIGEGWSGRAVAELGVAVARRAAAEAVIFGVKATVRVAAEAVMGFVGWALIVEQIGELAVLGVSDNLLQVWLTRCKFRKSKAEYGGFWGTVVHDKDAGNSYLSLDEEMKAFDLALVRSL